MNRGRIIQKREDLYIVRVTIGGKLYEYETSTKKEAKELLDRILKENRDL